MCTLRSVRNLGRPIAGRPWLKYFATSAWRLSACAPTKFKSSRAPSISSCSHWFALQITARKPETRYSTMANSSASVTLGGSPRLLAAVARYARNNGRIFTSSDLMSEMGKSEISSDSLSSSRKRRRLYLPTTSDVHLQHISIADAGER